MIYALESYQLRWGQTAAFAVAFAEVYRPLVEKHRGRLVGAWQPTAMSRRWPGAILLWEFETSDELQDLTLDLHLGPSPLIRRWEERTMGLVDAAEGRILRPSPQTPTRAQLVEQGVDLSVIVYEMIQTVPDRAGDYCEQIEEAWLPTADALGRIWIGTYQTMWKNQEAISLWAMKEPRRPMPDATHTAPGIRQWSRTAGSVRVGYDDGVFVALDGGAEV
jgi:hypothetical protein